MSGGGNGARRGRGHAARDPAMRAVRTGLPPCSAPGGDYARVCPRCGKERTCIGHDTTEVIDLIPAQVIVRVDRREKLACADCEAEVVVCQKSIGAHAARRW